MTLRRLLLRRLLIGLGLLALAFALDRHAHTVLRAVVFYEDSGEVQDGLVGARFLGSGLGTLVITLVVGLLDSRRGWRRAGALLLVVAASSAVGQVIKVMTGRERPSHFDQVAEEERLVLRGPRAGLHGPYQSFPSGHTLAAFASATCLSAFYPPARGVLYAVAGACAVNRVVKHQHFLSDVVAGALLGHLLALWLLARPALRRWWQQESVDSPGASP